MKTSHFKSLFLAGSMALTGCTGGPEASNAIASRAAELRDIWRIQNTAELPTVTRALLDSLTIPSLEVTIESREGAIAYLIPLVERNDPFHGPTTVWRTGDNAQIALRAGVIVGTKGLGNDLQGSDMRGSVRTVLGNDADEWTGAITYIDGAPEAHTIPLECVSQTPERTTIEIVELTYTVDHLRETCFTDSDIVINEYWVDPRDRTVWQSRQWIGPEIGYVRTRFLKKI